MPRAISILFWVLMTLCIMHRSASAQMGTVESGVEARVAFDAVGIGGRVRPGDWTPIRLTLTHAAPTEREVVCRWVLEDADGDTVLAERLVTLAGSDGGGEQNVWLYGVPPFGRSFDEPWRLQVVDAETGEELAGVRVAPLGWYEAGEMVVGVMSSTAVGLEAYGDRATSHEAVREVEGLNLAELPDRWMGLDSLSVLVWADNGGDPGGGDVSPAVLAAVREWVRRGGHLVLLMPSAGEPWTGSPLAEMLPVGAGGVRGVRGEPPVYLGVPGRREEIDAVAFDVDAGRGASVLARDREGRASVVAGRYGFGRVTLVGVDVSSAAVRGLRLTQPRQGLWNLVLGVGTPIFSQTYIDQERAAGEMDQPPLRRLVVLGDSLLAGPDRRSSSATSVLLAVMVLVVYWLVAGPGVFMLLKARGLAHRTWPVFVVVVAVFAGLTWGGAWLMRPGGAYVTHVTVLDIDGNDGEVRADAWVNAFVPRFGLARYGVGTADAGEGEGAIGEAERRDTLWAAGLPTDAVDAGGFLDPQTYRWNVADPGELQVPVRATTKRMRVRFRGSSDELRSAQGDAFGTVAAGVRVGSGGFPGGTLRHSLPGALENVIVVYAAGDGTVWVQPPAVNPGLTRWEPGVDVVLDPRFLPLVTPPGPPPRGEPPYAERKLTDEGFLGQLTAAGAGASGVTGTDSVAEVAKVVTLLSFYNLLPPPDFRTTGLMPANNSINYARGVARSWDLSHLTDARRIIVIGQLRDSPLPVPFTADGERLDSDGLTVVRWVLDL